MNIVYACMTRATYSIADLVLYVAQEPLWCGENSLVIPCGVAG